ncbi:hypothetical protein O0L34_g7379 [Tuta absoluta]|nr:hypothetical protein O0L34_g7379 [Tuta absoluta]
MTQVQRGKFASVRKLRHLVSGEEYAAKFIRKRRRAADTTREIQHEVAVLALCHGCTRVVRLHEVYETRSEVAIVLELAAGGELQRLLDEEERLTEGAARRALRHVLEGLAHLHARRVAHLDLKPQNLLLSAAGDELLICDFGISRAIQPGAHVREILGTRDYVAPEILSYEPLSLAADIWSVGVLAYVLVSGYSPFAGDTKQETYLNIAQCQLSFPKDLFRGVSEQAISFIQETLVVDPKGRLTVDECLEHPWLKEASDIPAVIVGAGYQQEIASEDENNELNGHNGTNGCNGVDNGYTNGKCDIQYQQEIASEEDNGHNGTNGCNGVDNGYTNGKCDIQYQQEIASEEDNGHNGTNGCNGMDNGYTNGKCNVQYQQEIASEEDNGHNGTNGCNGMDNGYTNVSTGASEDENNELNGHNGTNGCNGMDNGYTNGKCNIQYQQEIASEEDNEVNGHNGTNGCNGMDNGYTNGKCDIQYQQEIASEEDNGYNGTNGCNGMDNGYNNGKCDIQYQQEIASEEDNGHNGTNGCNGMDNGYTNGIDTNGYKSTNGCNGTNGHTGSNGHNGTNGTNGHNGVDKVNGVNGHNGVNGYNGTHDEEKESTESRCGVPAEPSELEERDKPLKHAHARDASPPFPDAPSTPKVSRKSHTACNGACESRPPHSVLALCKKFQPDYEKPASLPPSPPHECSRLRPPHPPARPATDRAVRC